MEEKEPLKTTEGAEGSEIKDKKEKPKSFWEWLASELYDYVEMFVFAAMAVLLLFTFGLRLCTVRGPSMEQTLYDGEQLLVSGFAYKPKQGDILIFHQTSDIYEEFNEPIVKRVIATEGQWIDINRATQTVIVYDEGRENPQILDESAYRYFDSGEWELPFAMSFPVRVPENHVFVMGDNRNHSSDSSTSAIIGFVDERRILGRVICRLTPIQKFGPVNN
jgi:signal peptidase I